jgi:hypothetical protein
MIQKISYEEVRMARIEFELDKDEAETLLNVVLGPADMGLSRWRRERKKLFSDEGIQILKKDVEIAMKVYGIITAAFPEVAQSDRVAPFWREEEYKKFIADLEMEALERALAPKRSRRRKD